ncbi:flagellin, partial [Paraburkholderia sp. SIMBA_054]|uniref:flagellin n=1 Tax=Paraburkholderia sp. SIMBA_054 TaxID=3085795 RepID=UPI003979469E
LRSGYAFGDSDYTFGEIVNSEITIPEDIHPNLTLQVGANSGDSFQVKLTDARTTALKIDGVDLSTRLGAEKSILKIDKAMATVSSERSKFGAYQNALEHVHNNVSNYELNLIDSES